MARPHKHHHKATHHKQAWVSTSSKKAAHHATLGGTKCSDCAVGLLKQYVSESLRNQKKLDPTNIKHHLQDDEEIEFFHTLPLSLQIVGLRRERSLSNRFDDLMVVLYDPASFKAGNETVLDDPELPKQNLASAQAYVDAVLGETTSPLAPKDWPHPGVEVNCLKCLHWRVMLFPITSEPGYDKDKHAPADEEGKVPPDFDNLDLLEDRIAAIAPGIYNGYYRVGLHKGSRKPPESFPALQLAVDSIPARRRYPIYDDLDEAQDAYDNMDDQEIFRLLVRRDKKAQKKARDRITKQLRPVMPHGTRSQRRALHGEVQRRLELENKEIYTPRIPEYRRDAARKVLAKLKKRINASDRLIRLENNQGAETRNLESEGKARLEVADDELSDMGVCLQVVFEAPSSHAPPPKPLKLTADDILVTFGAAQGTNIHSSVSEEVYVDDKGVERPVAWAPDRKVNNWSEACQVYRSPHDFRNFMRLAMLSKRALCGMRDGVCSAKLTRADVVKAKDEKLTEYIATCPREFALDGRNALAEAFRHPPLPEHPLTSAQREAAAQVLSESDLQEELEGDGFVGDVGDAFLKVLPSRAYAEPPRKRKKGHKQPPPKDSPLKLMKAYVREMVLARINESSTEDDVARAFEEALQDFTKKLVETRTSLFNALHKRSLTRMLERYVKDNLEPCDFDRCKYRFDYVLAEIPVDKMKTFVSRLGTYNWEQMFPEDAPKGS